MSITGKLLVLSAIVLAVRRVLRDEDPVPPPPPPPAEPPRKPTEAEIDAKLAALAERKGLADLNWKQSIEDLLLLLGLPNHREARGVLWADLGHVDEYRGTAEQNITMIGEVRRYLVTIDC